MTMLEKLKAAAAASEAENGELIGYALVTFHDGFYNMATAIPADEVEAMEVIEDIADVLGYNDEEGSALQ